ncbi:MAG: oligopeptide/dipeptide ABC transporter ATP-binding protein, partial [Steroidobacteraceae bacterium]
DDASFTIESDELLGLVGESGCGKSTLGRAILRLVPLAAGQLHWQGRRVDQLGRKDFRALRRGLQFMFQDPHASLDPRMTIIESVAEPLRSFEPGMSRSQRLARAAALLDEIGLAAELSERYPHQASGGQLQRACLARALIVGPRLVVCDEPVSALDVSVQGQIVNLLARIRRERGLASLFISHNLAVVAGLCERVMVMYLGRIVEIAPRTVLVPAPLHPYTRMLLDAVPRIARPQGRRLVAVPSIGPANVPVAGCAFAGRCPHVLARCRSERPALQPLLDGRLVACHRAAEWPGGLPTAES